MRWKRFRRRARSPFLRAGLGAGAWIVGRMSFPFLRRSGTFFGRLMHRSRSVRQLIEANLQVAFPEWSDEQRVALGAEVCRNICLTALETVWYGRHPEALDGDIVRLSDTAHEVLAESREGQAAVLITPHLGNWELAAQITCRFGVPLHAVVHQPKDSPTELFLDRIRRLHGLQLIPDVGAARPMLKALRAGESVGILIDQNVRPSDGGVFVKFFGLPVTCSRGPAMLCRKLNVPAVCFACLRQPGGFIMDAARMSRPIDRYDSDHDVTQELISIQERWIHKYPEQYMWFYKRWRYIPQGLPVVEQKRYPDYARPLQAHEQRDEASEPKGVHGGQPVRPD